MARNDAEVKFRLPAEQLDEWKLYAAKESKPLSRIIREAVTAHITREAVTASIRQNITPLFPPSISSNAANVTSNVTYTAPAPSRRCAHGRMGWCPVCDR